MRPQDRAARLVMERDLPSAQRDGRPVQKAGNAIFVIDDPPAFDPVFARIVVLPQLVAAVRHLLGSSDICLHFCNVTMKSPRVGSRINWHRDFPNRFMCPEHASFLRLMVCLDGMERENGATMIVPGSHRLTDGEARATPLPAAGVLQQTAVAVACGPGSAVFIHPKVIHGGPRNASSRHRRNLVVQWGRMDDPVRVGRDNAETLSNLDVGGIERWLRRYKASRAYKPVAL
jgi:ectoine hydroxylase-related dioxygenase (phytanoyl-CoA dioxygenase family)